MFTSAIICFIVKFFSFPLHSACHLGEVQQRRLGIIIFKSTIVETSLYHITTLDLNKPWYGKKKKNDRYEHDCTQEPNVAHESFPSFDSANGCLCQERLLSSRNFATMVTCSGRSRPSDKGGGDSQPDPEIRGRGGGG